MFANTNKKQAFTLIELLVVITIIGLLSTLAVFALNSASMKARNAKRMSDLKIISQALEVYYSDNNEYPINGTGAVSTCGQEKVIAHNGVLCEGSSLFVGSEIYINEIPTHPDGSLIESYTYSTSLGGSQEYFPPCLYTDGFEGGDVENWETFYYCQGGNCAIYDSELGIFCPSIR